MTIDSEATSGWDSEHYRYVCVDGVHNSFWATIVESPEWAAWEKEIGRRLRRLGRHLNDPAVQKENLRRRMRGEDELPTPDVGPLYDVDECRECNCMSPEHFADFVKFLRTKKAREARTKAITALSSEGQEETNG